MNQVLRNSFVISSFVVMAACTTATTKEAVQNISIGTFEKVSIGATESVVQKTIGIPQQNLKVKINKRIETVWFYEKPGVNAPQRAAVSFDINSQKVISKTFIPSEGEPEQALSFLLKNKFPSVKFETFHLPRCADLVPPESMSVDYESGISITFNRSSEHVESIVWERPKDALEHAQAIKKCLYRIELP